MNYTRLIPPTGERGVEQPPTHSTPRIFKNDFGTFYVIASEPYWSSRAAMLRRREAR
jgi:hypothetical protein